MRLTVKQLKNRDPGSGMAVVDREVLSELGASSGDFVAIEGRDGRRALARVWPSDRADAGRGFVRIDGQLRQAANVRIDDRVEVEPTDVSRADRITVALPGTTGVRGDLGSHIREHVQATAAGDESPVDDIELTAEHFEQALDEVDPSGDGDAGEQALEAGAV